MKQQYIGGKIIHRFLKGLINAVYRELLPEHGTVEEKNPGTSPLGTLLPEPILVVLKPSRENFKCNTSKAESLISMRVGTRLVMCDKSTVLERRILLNGA